MSRTKAKTFGRIALDKGYLEPDALDHLLDQQREMAQRQVTVRLGELLLLVGQLDVDQLFDVLSEQLERVRVCHHCDETFRVAASKKSSKKRPRCPKCDERMDLGVLPSLDQVTADMARLKDSLTRVDRKELARIKKGRFARTSKVRRQRVVSAKSLNEGRRSYKPAAPGPVPRTRPARLKSTKQARSLRRPSTRFSLKEVQQSRRESQQSVEPSATRSRSRSKHGMALLLLLVCLGSGYGVWRSSSAPVSPAAAAPLTASVKTPAVTQAMAAGRLVLIDGELALETGRGGRIWLIGEQSEAFGHMKQFLEAGAQSVYLSVRGRLISENGERLIEVVQWRRTSAAPGQLEITEPADR